MPLPALFFVEFPLIVEFVRSESKISGASFLLVFPDTVRLSYVPVAPPLTPWV